MSRWLAGLRRAFSTATGGAGLQRREARAFAMDITWVTERIGVGGGIWNAQVMAALVRAGVTHIIDMQMEFDDTELAEPFDVEVLWNPIDDDFQMKPPEIFKLGVDFADKALDQPDSKLFIHCAAGVHRAPMMTLAVMCWHGWDLKEAMDVVAARRPVVDFADVYVRSVENFLKNHSRPAPQAAFSSRFDKRRS